MTDVAVLLAAGRSQRFGPSDKLGHMIDGQPMLAVSAGNLAQCGADHLVAVLRDPGLAAMLPPPFTCVICRGQQSDSLRAGLRAARQLGATRLLVALADMPYVPSALMRRVLAASDGIRPACCAGQDGQPMPPACFPASWFDRIDALAGDRGAGALLRNGACRVIRAEDAQLRDIDRPPPR